LGVWRIAFQVKIAAVVTFLTRVALTIPIKGDTR
jgi:hypothetical protein